MKAKKKTSQYELHSNGSFVINDYNHSKIFSNFFPGVAGLYGIPMWVFYVNRGQCITSFGIESKDRAILEFQPANKAYRITSLQGFRTFLKIKKGSKVQFYEPFQNSYLKAQDVEQKMIITSHDLTLEEINHTLGLKVSVNYFTLPEESFAALVRRVSITNLGKSAQSIEMIDGLPAIVPYGLKDWLNKNISRTVEAWVKVRNLENKAPYYQLNVEVSDTPQVTHIEEGNFYFSFDSKREGNDKFLEPVVKSGNIFGFVSDFSVPEIFLKTTPFKVLSDQKTNNRTPSAMGYQQLILKSKETRTVTALTGFAHHIDQLNRIVKIATQPKYIELKAKRNEEIINDIKNRCQTVSGVTAFNHYCGQTFLDNVLRGGLPVSLETSEGPATLNVYSRKHGDLERDYNFFNLSPTFLSQGNGNYRDVNQNRRNDVWFNADVKDSNIVNFYNLVQADGYNPLIIKGLTFIVEDKKKAEKIVAENVQGPQKDKVLKLLVGGFMPGELLKVVSGDHVKIKGSAQEFLSKVLGLCRKNESAEHGEGFWSDHWTYNLDLVESFLAVYPEKLKSLLLEKKAFHFFLNNHYVRPRDKRFILTPKGVRQYHSVEEHDKDVRAQEKGFKLRVKNGEGAVYTTTLVAKMLCLLANKTATLDPSGVGIEMEANKPNWYDALNGLPGLLGSSTSETFEVKRHAQFLLDAFEQLNLADNTAVALFEELASFINGLSNLLTIKEDALAFWKKSNDLKESYRKSVRLGIQGEERALSVGELKKFLTLIIQKTDKGIAQVTNAQGLFPTYLYHEVVNYEILDKSHGEETPLVRPLSFERHELPMFLEGFVHALRSVGHPQKAKELYTEIKKSDLFDPMLKMYKVNADLAGESEEIGRTRIFPPGWLENESVWLHMEYKYLLELLRNGLHEEFYAELSHTLVAFLDPARYGRNILENSSFIVSSAHEDETLHGRGFVARLSGSTAEFVHMWLLMNVGPNPFELNSKGRFSFTLRPALADWLFTKKESVFSYVSKNDEHKSIKLPAGSYAFQLFGETVVVYSNPKAKSTFGPGAATIRKIILHYPSDKKPVEIASAVVPSPYAEDIRDRKLEKIEVIFD